MLKRNIFHVSQTPLVGAPAKLANAQRGIGHNSTALALNDYPGQLSKMFINDYLIDDDFCSPIISEEIKQADIIHIHNDINKDWAIRLLENNQSAMYLYHVHSPLREGPLYTPRENSIPLPFAAKLVVGQFQPRIHNDHYFVPNIITEIPSIRIRKKNEKLKVIFSPTHMRPGRWNNKHVEKLDIAIKSLIDLGKIEAIIPDKPVHPKMLMAARRSCHISIDEIATGGFHQVSLEGMIAGNIVINKADFFSKKVFSQFTQGETPPFLYSNGDSIAEKLLELADNYESTAELQLQSYNYALKYLHPDSLARYYDDIYETIQFN